MDVLIPIVIVLIIIVMLWGWSAALRRIALEDFGTENVGRVLMLESAAYRAQVLERGWLTNKEWTDLQKKHAAALAANKA